MEAETILDTLEDRRNLIAHITIRRNEVIYTAATYVAMKGHWIG